MNKQTLVDILRWRAAHQPDRPLFTFLDDDDHTEHLTYAELDAHARSIAAQLQNHNLAGERALLIYPPGLDFIKAFFGCLYADTIVVPTYPPRRNRPNLRLQAIVGDAQPTVVFSDLPPDSIPSLSAARWITRSNLTPHLADNWQDPPLTAETIAFLQYTSGSTSIPRGVVITHSNLLHNLQFIAQGFSITEESIAVIWAPPYHDMGLIGGILEPLYAGLTMVLMSPMAFLQNPVVWLQAITRYKATLGGGPNFAYDLCVDKIPPEQRVGLDLSSWVVAFNGSEPIRPQTLARFTNAFTPHGFRRENFYPCYGMAETTLMTAGGLAEALPVVTFAPTLNKEVVGCGQPAPGHVIKIVDSDQHHTLPEGQVGEIWVTGPSVSPGYWQQPEENKAVFGVALKDDPTQTGFLRTGDLGFIANGELFITGRRKDLIIIRGKNYYPHDIEHTAENSHLALQPHGGAAFSVAVEGEERVVIVFELRRAYRKANVDHVAAAIRAAVANVHELDIYRIVFIRPGHLPRTTSGKTQRYRCHDLLQAGELPIIGESVQTINRAALSTSLQTGAKPGRPQRSEAKIKAIIQTKLAEMFNTAPAEVDLKQPLPTLGLSSLDLMTLKGYIEAEFDLELDMDIFFEAENIEEIIKQFAKE